MPFFLLTSKSFMNPTKFLSDDYSFKIQAFYRHVSHCGRLYRLSVKEDTEMIYLCIYFGT